MFTVFSGAYSMGDLSVLSLSQESSIFSEKYKEFENEIISFNNLFEDGAKSFLRCTEILYNDIEHYKREHTRFFICLVSIYNLRKNISESDELTHQLKSILIVSLNGVEKKISSLLFCLEGYTND